jgi:hypothetical protein
LEKRGWRVVFFESARGAPRTGIIDAIAYRLARKNPDLLDIRIVQLKSGNAGIKGQEVTRLKQAAEAVKVEWLMAWYDGEALQLVPDDLSERQ